MKEIRSSKNRGFIKTIVLVVVLLIILGLFGFNLRDSVDNTPIVKDNLQYGWELAKKGAVKIYDFARGLLTKEKSENDTGENSDAEDLSTPLGE